MSIEVVLYVVGMFFLLISIHEWGHFVFAKRAGILVREFAIGFGPKLFSYKRGETTYTIRLLPIGGFVNMAGENAETVTLTEGQRVALTVENNEVTKIVVLETEQTSDTEIIGQVVESDLEESLWLSIHREQAADQAEVIGTTIYKVNPKAMVSVDGTTLQIAPKNRQFQNKTIWQRFITIFAGPMMNIILAFALFMLFIGLLGVGWDGDRLKIGDPVPSLPAERVGLKNGDEILSINGETLANDWGRLSELIDQNVGKEMTWVVLSDGQTKEIKIKSELSSTENGTQEQMVGISGFRRAATISELITGSWEMMKYFTKNILIGFKKLFTGDVKIEELGGPVKTVQVSAQFAIKGFSYMVYWSGILSLYLALFNLLPIPALDGSRIVFLMIEWLRGKPIPAHRESMVHIFGFVLMMGFMVFITYYDIAGLLK